MTGTVLQLSDIHLTAARGGPVSGCDPDERLAAVIAAWVATSRPADLVVLSGDNADDGSAAAYARLAAVTGQLAAPVLALAGNHDVPAEMEAAFGGQSVAEVGAWRIVGLDSSRPHQVHGTIDAAAAAALLDGLDGRPTIVGIHHPPVSRSRHQYFQLDGGDELLAALGARPHVRALISGHLHDPFDFEGPAGLALLGCPSTLVSMRHTGDTWETAAGGPTGARVLDLGDDGTLVSTILAA